MVQIRTSDDKPYDLLRVLRDSTTHLRDSPTQRLVLEFWGHDRIELEFTEADLEFLFQKFYRLNPRRVREFLASQRYHFCRGEDE